LAHPAVAIPICFVCYYGRGQEVLNRILTGAIPKPTISIGGLTAEEHFGVPTEISRSFWKDYEND
jgi:hypothetical protein